MTQWTLDQFNTALSQAGLTPLTQAQYDANPNVSVNADNSPSSPAQYVQSLQKINQENTAENSYPGGKEAYIDAVVAQNTANNQKHNTGFGGLLNTLASNPIVDAIGAFALGPELGAISGWGSTAGAAEAGALIGGGTSALEGQNPLVGALKGGAEAGITSGIFNNAGSIGDFSGLTTDASGQSLGQLTGFNDFLSSNTGISAGGSVDPATGQASSSSVGNSAPGSGGAAIGGAGPGAAASAAPSAPGIFDNGGDVSSQFSSGISSGDSPTSLDSSGLNSFTAANSPNFSADGVDPAGVSPSASPNAVNLTGANGVVNPDQGSIGASSGATGNAGTGSFDINGGISSGTPQLSDMGSNITSGGSTGSTIGDLGNTLTGGSNTPSPGTISANNNTFGSLQNMNFPSLDGGSDMNLGQIANAPVSGGAGAGVKAPNTVGQFLNNPLSLDNFGSMLSANAGSLVAGGGLAANLIEGNKPVKGENQVNQAAATDTAQGQQLQSYLASGTLPPGIQQGINQQAEAQKAQIRSRYAQMGGSGSSAEQQDLAAVDQQSQAQGSAIALQLLQAGMNESNEGSSLYQSIAQNALQQDKDLGSSLSAFVSSLAGGGGGNQTYTLRPAGT